MCAAIAHLIASEDLTDEVEDCEEHFLLRSGGAANHPKRETVEQCCSDVEGDLVVNVVDVPVEGHIHALGNKSCLFDQGSGKFVPIILCARRLASRSSDDIYSKK